MASGKINLFNLGANGVDLVKSPLHLPDGAWRLLQNGEFSADKAQGGVKKRGSLNALNSVALAGAVRAMINVPLPLAAGALDPGGVTAPASQLLLVALLDDLSMVPPTWTTSPDGVTFTPITAATLPRYAVTRHQTGVTLFEYLTARVLTYHTTVYYPGNDYNPDTANSNAPLNLYTAAGVAAELLRVPLNGSTDPTADNVIGIFDMLVANDLIYFSVWDHGGVAPNHKGRVFSLDAVRGLLTEIGNRFGDGAGENAAGFPVCLAWYAGRLWAGTFGVAGNNLGKLYSIVPGIDDAWTLDHSATLHNGYYQSLAAYAGSLFLATDSDISGTAIIQKRAADGTVTTATTAPDAGVSAFGGLIVFDNKLYASWRIGGAGAKTHIYQFDGTTWTKDLDVGVTYAVATPGMPFIFKGALYWTMGNTGGAGFLLKRTTGGVWSQPIAAGYIMGPLGAWTPSA